jgi:hypothetical protein
MLQPSLVRTADEADREEDKGRAFILFTRAYEDYFPYLHGGWLRQNNGMADGDGTLYLW